MVRHSALIEIDRVSKRFPGVLALDDVSIDFRAGEVHGIIGENGAGKSTLLNILAGNMKPDGGIVRIEGRRTSVHSPRTSQELGIAVVYQELSLCPNLNAAENIMLPQLSRNSAASMVRRTARRREAKRVLAELGIDTLDLDAPVRHLSVAERQLVEIARAIGQRARVLVLDEPNSALAMHESERLFEIIGKLRTKGVLVIFVSHHLQEVLALADRISILRDGRRIVTIENRNVSEDRLIRAMVGRNLDVTDQWSNREEARVIAAPKVLDVRHLTSARLCRVSFTVRAGEIVGVAGLPDSGMDTLGETLLGLIPRKGSVFVDNAWVPSAKPAHAIRAGIAFVPADRRGAGAFLSMSVANNIVAASLHRFSAAGFLHRGRIHETARAQVVRLRARISSIHQRLATLSGGNQQKIILSRGLVTQPRVLILHEPTRGIDVGAKAEIYTFLRDIARHGVAILIISSDLPELVLNAARVIVMRDGRIAGEISGDQINEEAILAYALVA